MAKAARKAAPKIVFRKNDKIGSPEAETDQEFLDNCFVETGDLDVLTNCSDARRIIVGRTGSGKSALIREVRKKAQ